MSENKNTYHRALDGTYAVCDATVKACPRGGHIALSGNEVAELVATGHPAYDTLAGKNRLAKRSRPRFLVELEDDYDQLRKARLAEAKFAATYEKAVKQYNKENPRRHQTATLGELAEGGRVMRDLAIEALVDAGVSPAKARLIHSDTPSTGEGAFYPPVKKRDKYDADIKAKTEAAQEALRNNPEYTKHRNRVIEHNAALKENAERRAAIDQIRRQIMLTQGVAGAFGGTMDDDPGEKKALSVAKARQWASNGNFPEETEMVDSITDIHPYKVTLNMQGEFTNLWYGRADGSVVRITRYRAARNRQYGEPSEWFETEDGERLVHETRHANYKKTIFDPAKGDTRIFLSKPGEDEMRGYPTYMDFLPRFVIDSGG